MSEGKQFSAKGNFELATSSEDRPPDTGSHIALLKAASEAFDYARQYLDKYQYWPDYILATHYRGIALALSGKPEAADQFKKVADWLTEEGEKREVQSDTEDIRNARLRLRQEALYNAALLDGQQSIELLRRLKLAKGDTSADKAKLSKAVNGVVRVLGCLWHLLIVSEPKGIEPELLGVPLAAEFAWLRFYRNATDIHDASYLEWPDGDSWFRRYRAFVDTLTEQAGILINKAIWEERFIVPLQRLISPSYGFPLSKCFDSYPEKNDDEKKSEEEKMIERLSDFLRQAPKSETFDNCLQIMRKRLRQHEKTLNNMKEKRTPIRKSEREKQFHEERKKTLSSVLRTIQQMQSIITKKRKDAAVLVRMKKTLDTLAAKTKHNESNATAV